MENLSSLLKAQLQYVYLILKNGHILIPLIQAVDYAARGDCDIISMSWTIEEITVQEGNNTAAIKKLKTALDLAIRNGKLLFCSAPDEGGFDANCYPLVRRFRKFGCPSLNVLIALGHSNCLAKQF